MLKAEWQKLLKNKFLLVVLFVIALIPSIYAVTFLKSMWDPYGELDKLPVAIVDQDQAATMNGKTLTVGKDLTANLMKNHELDFHHVSAKTAKAGLDSGKYYAVYTIPREFSHNATTLLSNDPQTMKLNVKTTAGRSFIAAKMASSAGTTMQKQLNGQIASTYTKTLVAAVQQLSTGISKAATGSTKLASGAKQVNTGSKTLTSNLNTLANGTLTLADGSKTLTTGIGSYVQAASTAATGSAKVSSGLTTVNSKLPTLTTGLTTMATGSEKLTSGLKQAQTGTVSLATGAATLNRQLAAYTSGTQTVAANSKAFSEQLNAFAKQLTAVMAKSQSTETQLTQLATLLKNLQTALGGLTSTSAATAVGAAVTSEAQSLGLTEAQTQQLAASAKTATTTQQAKTLKTLTPLMTQLQTALTALATSSTGTSTTAATTGLTKLTSAGAQLAAANATLATNAAKLTAGSQTLASGIKQVNAADDQLATGAQTLTAGIQSATPQVATLASGVTKLTTGANTLTSGLNTLATKGTTLKTGATTLESGLATAATGTSKLATGGKTLTAGATTLTAGTQTLAKSLNAVTVPQLHYTSKQSKAFASPIALKTTDKDAVPNNGTGMAPYMMGVALFVCALALNLMFDAYTPSRRPKNGVDWWASKMVVMEGIAALAGTLELLLVKALDGLAPVNFWQTWALLVLGAMTFMAIVTWLNLVLGKAGSGLAMILLVLQLGGSGGTYPIVLSNGFFEAIHPYLPLSYIVDGLRSTISIGDTPTTAFLALGGMLIGFLLLNLLHYIRLTARMAKIDFNEDAALK